MPEMSPPRPASRRIPIAIGAVVAAGVVGLGAFYGLGGLKRGTGGDPSCAGAVELARKISPLAHGEVAALTMATSPLKLPDLAFEDGEGKPRKLSEWRGKTVLVNLWATWCVPCRKEMPALDHLQSTLGEPAFEVVAVNLDTRDPEKPRAFLSEIGVKALAFYADPATRTFQALRSVGRGFGLPTTLLIDRDGCELGYLAGPAEWGGADAEALVRAAIASARAEVGASTR